MLFSVDEPALSVTGLGPFTLTMLFSVDEPALPVAGPGAFSSTIVKFH